MDQQHERVGLVASRTQLRHLVKQIQQAGQGNDAAVVELRERSARILDDAKKSTSSFLDICVTDPSGRAVTATNEDDLKENFSQTPEFQRGKTARHLGEPTFDGQRYIAMLSSPAYDDEANLLGVVMVRLDVTSLRDLLNDPTGLGHSGEVLVARREGDMLHFLFPPRKSGKTLMPRSDVPIMSRAIDGGEGAIEGRDYRGENALAVYHPVAYQDPEFQPWAMVAKFDAEETYAPVSTLHNLLLLLNVGLLVVAVLGATWLARLFTRPLTRLTQQADEIASGDLSTRAEVESKDEIGTLAEAFNHMADRLRASHEELEERVEMRTCELQLAQEELRRLATRTRRILDTTSDAFVAMDEEGVIIDWNPAAEQIFGWLAEEALGRTVAELIVPASLRQRHLEGLERFLVSGDGPVLGQRIEVTALHKDGREFSIELTISPLRDGDEWAFNAFIHDITERKQAELELQKAKEAAEKANRAKSDFLANMSHEIRTPMNAIMGMTELTLDTELDAAQRENLEIVLESADHLLTIINEILDFSKIEAGRVELEVAPFSLRESLGDTMKVLAVRAHRKELELAYHVAPDVPDGLLGDVARLRQIIINLAGNAIKFTDKGEVLVDVASAARDDGRIDLTFAVHDTGIGIPAESLHSIFDSFTQADASTTRRFGGTGLGLSICLQLVHLMGGRIWAESQLEQGSSFCFTLPAALAPDAAVTQPAEEADVAGLRVLIVDDNETNRKILNEIVGVWGMDPICVASGAEGLAAFEQAAARRQPLRLVLTDLHMPAMDGLEFIARLRDLPSGQQPVVIMLTSGERPSDVQRRAELNIPTCLLKPVKQSDLLEAILMQIGSRRVVREAAEAPASKPIEPLRPLRILVAEDGTANRKLLAALLGKWGHTCVFAENGLVALDQFSRDKFDLILMDIEMPQLDGWQATERIREREQETGSGHVPIVALTAHALAGDEQRCLNAGMDGYVSKPISSRRLRQAIALVLDERPSAGAGSAQRSAECGVSRPHAAGQRPNQPERRLGRPGGRPRTAAYRCPGFPGGVAQAAVGHSQFSRAKRPETTATGCPCPEGDNSLLWSHARV